MLVLFWLLFANEHLQIAELSKVHCSILASLDDALIHVPIKFLVESKFKAVTCASINYRQSCDTGKTK